MASAFNAAPAGYANLNSSYVGDEGASFNPQFGRVDDRSRGRPFHFAGRGLGPGFGLGFMGGGVFGGFIGNGFVRAIFASQDKSCAFASGTGLVTCEPSTHGAIAIPRASIIAMKIQGNPFAETEKPAKIPKASVDQLAQTVRAEVVASEPAPPLDVPPLPDFLRR